VQKQTDRCKDLHSGAGKQTNTGYSSEQGDKNVQGARRRRK